MHRVSTSLASLRPNVSFPDENELDNVIRDFYEVAHFPGVLGETYCTHVAIQSPGREGWNISNQKMLFFYQFSSNTACDYKLLITDFNVRWPGSVHVSNILLINKWDD